MTNCFSGILKVFKNINSKKNPYKDLKLSYIPMIQMHEEALSRYFLHFFSKSTQFNV